jgi:hypothetical protein
MGTRKLSLAQVLFACVAASTMLLASCTTILSALLIQELLDDKAPRFNWTGVVEDTTGEPVEGVEVEVRGEVSGDEEIATFDDVTDNTGSYDITFRYNEEVSYSVRVTKDGSILAEQSFGRVDDGDKVTNFTIQGTVNASISGTVEDSAGDPIEDAVLIAATAADANDAPTVLKIDDNIRFDVSGESGIYEIEGAVQDIVIVCAYHPEHGFAYGVTEDDDSDGNVALNMVMGGAGNHDVQVQVVDSGGNPIALQVLAAERQFRLRLDTPYNLGESIDEIVMAEALFPGLIGVPSDSHPQPETLSVVATSLGGFAEGSLEVPGSTYDISLLNIGDSDPATALVNSANPLPVDGDETVIVRVN